MAETDKINVLIIIGAYDSRHIDILQRNVAAYESYRKYDCQIVIMAGEPMSIQGNVEWRYFDQSLGELFLWRHQDVIKEKADDDWQLLAFIEDDVLITEDNLDYFIEHSEVLKGTEYCPGYLRYEQWGDKRNIISVSLDEWNMGECVAVNDVRYWAGRKRSRMRPTTHQMGFVLDRPRFMQLMKEQMFDIDPHLIKYGRGRRFLRDLESSTNWMWAYNFRKVYALDDLHYSLLLHCDHYKNHPMGDEVNEFIETVSR